MKKKVIIVGGGAAGLMAAGRAAEAGAEVVLLEKMRQPGLKICITGKGRCNITNIADVREFIGHFGKTGNFLRQAFARFFSDDLVRFGVPGRAAGAGARQQKRRRAACASGSVSNAPE